MTCNIIVEQSEVQQPASTMTIEHLSYLPHLDGLRSLALLYVLLFHFRVFGAVGGYLGVDIFLVLSGFLMTRIILRDVIARTFSMRAFMTRRFWRLYPALLVTVACTRATACLIFTPKLRVEVERSTLSSLLFSSNLYFMRTATYFGVSSDLKPLLHTWSLSLEEQFYIFWPLFLMFTYRALGTSNHRLTVAIACVTVSSFSLATANARNDSFTFFSLPTRIFEFTVGGLVALNYQALARMFHEPVLASAVSFASVVLMTHPVFRPPSSISPGTSSICTLLGTALLIVTPRSLFAEHVLSSRPARFFAKISYSAYLVHWPIWVYGSFINGGPIADKISLFATTLVFAYLLYIAVENPCRRQAPKKHIPILTKLSKAYYHKVPLFSEGEILSKSCFSICSTSNLRKLGMLAMLVGTLTPSLSSVVRNNKITQKLSRTYVVSSRYEKRDCKWIPLNHEVFKTLNGSKLPHACYIGSRPVVGEPLRASLVVAGSSFAQHIIPAMRELSLRRNESYIVMHSVDCPLIGDPTHRPPYTNDACIAENARRMAVLRSLPPTPVLLADKWAGRFFHRPAGHHPYKGPSGAYGYFRSTVQALKKAGHSIAVLGEPPVLGERRFERVRTCDALKGLHLWRNLLLILGKRLECPTELTFDIWQVSFEDRIRQFLERNAATKNVRFLSVLPAFCSMASGENKICRVRHTDARRSVMPDATNFTSDGPHYYYSEGIHLSEMGAWQTVPLLDKFYSQN